MQTAVTRRRKKNRPDTRERLAEFERFLSELGLARAKAPTVANELNRRLAAAGLSSEVTPPHVQAVRRMFNLNSRTSWRFWVAMGRPEPSLFRPTFFNPLLDWLFKHNLTETQAAQKMEIPEGTLSMYLYKGVEPKDQSIRQKLYEFTGLEIYAPEDPDRPANGTGNLAEDLLARPTKAYQPFPSAARDAAAPEDKLSGNRGEADSQLTIEEEAAMTGLVNPALVAQEAPPTTSPLATEPSPELFKLAAEMGRLNSQVADLIEVVRQNRPKSVLEGAGEVLRFFADMIEAGRLAQSSQSKLTGVAKPTETVAEALVEETPLPGSLPAASLASASESGVPSEAVALAPGTLTTEEMFGIAEEMFGALAQPNMDDNRRTFLREVGEQRVVRLSSLLGALINRKTLEAYRMMQSAGGR